MDKLSEKINSLKCEIFYPAHGGNRHTVLEELGVLDEHVIDFSVSVNPLGPSPNMRLVLRDMESLLSEYPDPSSMLFCEKVSEYLKISLDQILVTNGSTELIHLLPRALGCNKQALILNPCFSEYERVFRLNQIHTHSLNYDVERMFQIDSEKVISHLRDHPEIEMLVLGNPNNPTGHLWGEKSLEVLVGYCKSQKIILVVDETFIDFCHETVSALKWIRNNQYLVVVRSMTKFFGLAGVRLGYGVMHPDLRARLKKYQILWSVNAVAQKMGIVALEDNEYSIQTRKMMDEQRVRLFSGLDTIPGIRVFPSQANFLLFQLLADTSEDAYQFYLDLLRDGILIRNCGNFSGLNKSYFRVAVRTEKENQILASRIEAQLGKEC